MRLIVQPAHELDFVFGSGRAVTAIRVEHQTRIFGRALGHGAQTGPCEQRIRPSNFQLNLDSKQCGHFDRSSRLLVLGPVVILEGNNHVEIVINPDFGQTRSHALACIGRILEKGSPDQMGHLVTVEVKPWPRIYN